MKPKVREMIPYMDEPYIKVTASGIEIDRNLAKFEIVNFKVVNGIYGAQVNMVEELKQAGLNITDNSECNAPKEIKLAARQRVSFKELFEEYVGLKETRGYEMFVADYRREMIENIEPLVKEAYDKLGAETVREMKHKKSNIARKLIAENGKKLNYRIVELLDMELPKWESIPQSAIKERLQRVYDLLGIKRTAKATDIKEWYDVKPSWKNKDGYTIKCFTIIRSKIVRVRQEKKNKGDNGE